MESSPVRIVNGSLTDDAPLDTAISRAILQQVSDGDLPETLQIGTPHRVVAFGKHDSVTTGFDDAVNIAVDMGFDPTIRTAGGRAVVFHNHVIRFAWTVPAPDPVREMQSRFSFIADTLIRTLASFGVESVVGELPGEYCPGRYSVLIPGEGKVMGTGQRLSRHAAQVGGMIVVSDTDSINKVLVPVYRALSIDMDPAATGAVSHVVDIDAPTIALAFAELVVGDRASIDVGISDETRSIALAQRSRHNPRILA